jgi:hypothetical protein
LRAHLSASISSLFTTEKEKAVAKKKKVDELKNKEQEMVKMLTQALEMVKGVEYPMDQEGREKFFMECLQKGELLYRQGT